MGILFVCLAGHYFRIDEILLVLKWHLLLAIFFLIYAYGTSKTSYVHYLYDKGLPFLIAPMGFTSTVQTFGTLCLSYIIISFKENKKSFFGIIVIFLLLSTFNRVSYVNILIFVFLFKPKYLWVVLLFGTLLLIVFSDYAFKILGAIGTILSRFHYLDNYLLSFENSNFFQKIFGNSNSLITDSYILSITKQPLIENGFFSLLNVYGILGIFLLCVLLLFLFFLDKKKLSMRNKIYFSYFVTIGQFMTNEYFSTTFYFAVMCIIYVSNIKNMNIDRNIKMV
jgi:hypothetical protein